MVIKNTLASLKPKKFRPRNKHDKKTNKYIILETQGIQFTLDRNTPKPKPKTVNQSM